VGQRTVIDHDALNQGGVVERPLTKTASLKRVISHQCRGSCSSNVPANILRTLTGSDRARKDGKNCKQPAANCQGDARAVEEARNKNAKAHELNTLS
jgi:hypothetical protein